MVPTFRSVPEEETLIRGDQGVGVTNLQRNFTAGQNIDFHFPWSGSLS
jgi:hypothetical protein